MNNKLILFLALIFFVTACNEKSRRYAIEAKVHPSDTTCMIEIEKAKVDIKYNRLVYCVYWGFRVEPMRAKYEMVNLLKTYNIKFQIEDCSDIVRENRIENCYCECMREEINERFGNKFIDSLLYIADSLWVLKNLDKIFTCGGWGSNDCWDKPAMFPGDSVYDQTNHSGLQQEFEKLVQYPTDYKFKEGKEKNEMAFLSINLDIDENGKAKVTKFGCYITKYNEEHCNYFKSIAIPLIENTKWTPATIKSIGVKSKNEIFIYLK